jgi:hypothetical protein
MAVNVGKDEIRSLLLSGQAVVETLLQSHPRPGGRCVSDVWTKFGKVRLLSDESLCKDAVACSKCFQVYVHRSKRQGTSSLRLHRCSFPGSDPLAGNIGLVWDGCARYCNDTAGIWESISMLPRF